MVKPMEVTILDNYDSTKKWLSDRVYRNIFPNDPEFKVLSALIDRHPAKHTWKNQNPISFNISRLTGNGVLVLYVKFEGLNKYRIVSWVSCARGKLSKKPDNKFNGAMRYAIRLQVSKYRKNNTNRVCDICDSKYKIEVDHYPVHFVNLKNDFVKIKLEKDTPPPTEYKWHPKRGNFMFKNGTKSNNYYDKKWKQSWQRYHNKHASYRYLCSTCNKTTTVPFKPKPGWPVYCRDCYAQRNGGQ